MTDRSAIRSKILSNVREKFQHKVITFFGIDVEIRQPSLRTVLSMRDSGDEDRQTRAATLMLLNYTYVPGTNEKVFEDGDVDTLLELPFNADMKRFTDTVNELTGLNVEQEIKNSEETQPDETY